MAKKRIVRPKAKKAKPAPQAETVHRPDVRTKSGSAASSRGGDKTASESWDGGVASAPGARPATGPSASDYEGFWVKGEIGRGGFGVVYLAREEPARRDVALKAVGKPATGRKRGLARFLDEACITAQLQHPGIVPIYRIDKDREGREFYTMRPIEGRTLKAILDQLKAEDRETLDEFPLRRLVQVFHAVCQTIRFAHDRGVIHRDLKPSNIVVGDYGEVLVIDWGLAKVMKSGAGGEEGTAEPAEAQGAGVWALYQRRVENPREKDDTSPLVTLDGAFLGTPAYASPEQALGHVSEIDPRTDIWSLGVLLYELCTLRLPFKGSTACEMVKNLTTVEPRDPIHVNPARRVPPELAHIALRCLRRDKSERYASVGDLARDIGDWLEGLAPWRTVVDMDFTKMPDGPVPGCTVIDGDWRVEGGQMRARGDVVNLLLLDAVVAGDTRVEMEAMVPESEQGEITAILAPAAASTMEVGQLDRASYFLQFGANYNTCARIRKSLSTLATVEAFCERNCWYHVTAERTNDVLRLVVDGEELVRGRDLYPTATERVGLYTYFPGITIKRFRVLTRGASTVTSCLEVPRAFRDMGMIAEAKEKYLRIATIHPGREEGLEALFHAGRCALDLAGKETDPARREGFLKDAWDLFQRLEESYLAPLGCLGKSFVWESRRQLEKEAEELVRAHREYPHHDTIGYVTNRLWQRADVLRFDPRFELFLLPAAELDPVGLLGSWVANAAAEMMDPSTARRLIRGVVERIPDRRYLCHNALDALSWTVAREGRYEEAIRGRDEETLRAESETESASQFAKFLLAKWIVMAAKIRCREGRWDAAVNLARQVLAGTWGAYEELRSAVLVITECLLREGRYDEAIEQCGRLMSNPRASTHAYMAHARIHVARKDFAEAMGYVDKMPKEVRYALLVPHAKALIHLCQGKTEAAKECLELAVSEGGGYGREQVKALYTLASIHALEGDREKVLEILERLSREFVDWAARAALHPDDAHAVERARLWSLDVLWRKRRQERAAALTAWARTGDAEALRRIEEWARDDFDNFADVLRADVEYI